jgi:hypothetical protein
MDGNKEVEFAQNGRERDNLVSCSGRCYMVWWSVGDTKEIEVGKGFRAYLAWDRSTKAG